MKDSKLITRKRNLSLNLITSIIYQIVSIVVNLILPRVYLQYYGSEMNGLMNSITQFLGYIVMADMGIAAVLQSALYKPLSSRDNYQISNVFNAGKRFYNRIGIIIIAYIIGLLFLYPFIVKETFDYIFTFTLIFSMSISAFAQYYLGLCYQTFLTADQHHFIQVIINTITIIANAIITVLLVVFKIDIRIVKLASSLIFLSRPLLMKIYIRRHYSLDYQLKPTKDALPQKWNGVAQHIAAVVLENTDMIVLTIFASLSDVSIYSVYYMVVASIRQLINIIVSSIEPTLGNIYGSGEKENFQKSFEYFEWIVHTITIFMFICTAILIVPFVKIYTSGITDANYDVPVFAIFICLAYTFVGLELPYKSITRVVGAFKQTQLSSIIEMVLNIVVSITMVFNFGLVGVAIGTLVAKAYKYLYLSNYCYSKIFKIKILSFAKQNIINIFEIALLSLLFLIVRFNNYNFLEWLEWALMVGAICLSTMVILNILFQKKFIAKTLYFFKKMNN